MQAPLGLEAREGDLLRLIAQRLEDARVAQRDRRRVGDGAGERELVLAESERRACARRKSTPIGLSSKRMGRSASELKPAGGSPVRTTSSSGWVRVSSMTSGSPVDSTSRISGYLLEIDGQIAQLLVVAGGDDVADVALVADEHDAAAIDLARPRRCAARR